MNNVLQQMLERYHPSDNEQRENAIKEIFQEIALAGLSRGGFFRKAAFYGGTCLRIFHGLPRFSEDLDFALVSKDPNFKIENYFSALEKEFLSYGISIDIQSKRKDFSFVQSAFLKSNTLMLMLSFFPESEDAKHVVPDQKIKIKFEIDIDNPPGGETEYQFRTLPSPYEIQIFDEPSLFAGKIAAILCRNYKNNVKGRDFYDYLFFVTKGSAINIEYLESKLHNTGGIIDQDEHLSLDKVKQLLKERFESTNYSLAIDDVSRFIDNHENLELWNKDLFISTLDQLKCI